MTVRSAARLTRSLAKQGLGLASLIAIAGLFNMAPSLAATPTAADPSETMMVAGLFDTLDNVINTVERGLNVINSFEAMAQAQREEEARQLRELEAIRVQDERDQAAAAAAQQRLQYWESLTPEEKEAYIAEQREREQDQADAVATLLLIGLFGAGSDEGSHSDTRSDYDVIYEQPRPSTSSPAHQPVTPIGGDSGIYGNGPRHGY